MIGNADMFGNNDKNVAHYDFREVIVSLVWCS